MAASKRSDPRVERLLQALRLGNTRRAATRFAEIDSSTFYRWLERSPSFRAQVEQAEADAEVRFMGRIATAAAAGTWQSAAWWLERRYPADFGQRARVDLHVQVRAEVERIAAERGLDRDELMSMLRAILPGLEL